MARVDLESQPGGPPAARLRVVTPVPDAEVFLDGASAGPAPLDRNDLAPGKHCVVVRAPGFAEWKREVELNPASPMTLSAELSASGTVKILSNVGRRQGVPRRGSEMGKTPVTLENVAGRRAPGGGEGAGLSSMPGSRCASRAVSRRFWPPTCRRSTRGRRAMEMRAAHARDQLVLGA